MLIREMEYNAINPKHFIEKHPTDKLTLAFNHNEVSC